MRPIVLGKEVKSIEFVAECNNILVDGISFIEKLSFNAFNKGTRLPHSIKMHKRLLEVDVKKIGGDTSYAGTINPDYCKEKGIQILFVKPGRSLSPRKERERHCETGAYMGHGYIGGRIVWALERAL